MSTLPEHINAGPLPLEVLSEAERPSVLAAKEGGGGAAKGGEAAEINIGSGGECDEKPSLEMQSVPASPTTVGMMEV